MKGLKEQNLRARLTLSEVILILETLLENSCLTLIQTTQPLNILARKEISRVTLEFEIPMFNCSNIHISYLRIVERSEGYDPQKWIRYVTQPRSYCVYIN